MGGLGAGDRQQPHQGQGGDLGEAKNGARARTCWSNIYSKGLLRILYCDSLDGHTENKHPPSSDAASAVPSLCDGVPDNEIPPMPDGPRAPRSLAVHPDGKQVACGDKQGNIQVFSLKDMELKHTQAAHDAEVLCLSFSPFMVPADINGAYVSQDQDNQPANLEAVRPLDPDASSKLSQGTPAVLLASASRDRLVHLFDASEDKSRGQGTNDPGQGTGQYALLQTMDNHSSSVTAIKFSMDGKRLFSAGGDKMLVLSHVNGLSVSRYKSVGVPQGTIYGLDVDPTNKYLLTAGQDKKLNIWSIVSGRHMRSYRLTKPVPGIKVLPVIFVAVPSCHLSQHLMHLLPPCFNRPEGNGGGELYKVDLDPAGIYAATCSFDKWIRLFDFYSGRCLAKVRGHSELVTGVRFTQDGRRLISIGGDGCIFVWRLNSELQRASRERLGEMYPHLHRSTAKETDITQSKDAESRAKAKEEAKARLKIHSSKLPSWAMTRREDSDHQLHSGHATEHLPLPQEALPQGRWAQRRDDELRVATPLSEGAAEEISSSLGKGGSEYVSTAGASRKLTKDDVLVEADSEFGASSLEQSAREVDSEAEVDKAMTPEADVEGSYEDDFEESAGDGGEQAIPIELKHEPEAIYSGDDSVKTGAPEQTVASLDQAIPLTLGKSPLSPLNEMVAGKGQKLCEGDGEESLYFGSVSESGAFHIKEGGALVTEEENQDVGDGHRDSNQSDDPSFNAEDGDWGVEERKLRDSEEKWWGDEMRKLEERAEAAEHLGEGGISYAAGDVALRLSHSFVHFQQAQRQSIQTQCLAARPEGKDTSALEEAQVHLDAVVLPPPPVGKVGDTRMEPSTAEGGGDRDLGNDGDKTGASSCAKEDRESRDGLSRQERRKETEDAVEKMRVKLASMGFLESHPDPVQEGQGHVHGHSAAAVMPPAPPSKHQETEAQGQGDRSGSVTGSKVTGSTSTSFMEQPPLSVRINDEKPLAASSNAIKHSSPGAALTDTAAFGDSVAPVPKENAARCNLPTNRHSACTESNVEKDCQAEEKSLGMPNDTESKVAHGSHTSQAPSISSCALSRSLPRKRSDYAAALENLRQAAGTASQLYKELLEASGPLDAHIGESVKSLNDWEGGEDNAVGDVLQSFRTSFTSVGGMLGVLPSDDRPEGFSCTGNQEQGGGTDSWAGVSSTSFRSASQVPEEVSGMLERYSSLLTSMVEKKVEKTIEALQSKMR
ncbi:unnamed protein product [Chrysoparadoxa australica]